MQAARGRRRGRVRLTLLDACYLHGGLPPGSAMPRVGRLGARVSAWSPAANGRLGAAIHSVRAVDPDSARRRRRVRGRAGWPLHAHVSEQPAENDGACAEPTARRRSRCSTAPARCRNGSPPSTPRTLEATCAAGRRQGFLLPVSDDRARPRRRHRTCSRCATRRSTLGSDSQAVIDPFEEARAVELDERLATGVRGRHTADELAARPRR